MRKAGVLLHISSLPGEFGCGTFGKWAYAFADFLAEGGFQIWQVLPFNLPHRDASPYSSVSTFVQNSLFIDPEILCNKNLLTPEEVERLREEVPQQGREYYDLAQHRERYLRLAAERAGKSEVREKVSEYIKNSPFVGEACNYLAKDNPTEENRFYYYFLQYEFYVQWEALHKYLSERNIEVIGDIPIYVDLHSSEVFHHPECFLTDKEGKVSFVSGVPGDDFNDAGQKWNHPLYSTEALAAQNYDLLFDRMAFAASFYDVIRIDHFQAIAAYYAIPVDGHPRDGHWEKGVGEPFVRRLSEEIGKNRFIVEDFNCFPGGSHALAVKYGFPDMQTLQSTLTWGGAIAEYPVKTVAYTGTHDNNTLLGYMDSVSEEHLQRISMMLDGKGTVDKQKLCELAIRALLASPAERTVIQAQDLLFEDGKSRMNVPGISGQGNWLYRITKENLTRLAGEASEWKQMLSAYGRLEE